MKKELKTLHRGKDIVRVEPGSRAERMWMDRGFSDAEEEKPAAKKPAAKKATQKRSAKE